MLSTGQTIQSIIDDIWLKAYRFIVDKPLNSWVRMRFARRTIHIQCIAYLIFLLFAANHRTVLRQIWLKEQKTTASNESKEKNKLKKVSRVRVVFLLLFLYCRISHLFMLGQLFSAIFSLSRYCRFAPGRISATVVLLCDWTEYNLWELLINHVVVIFIQFISFSISFFLVSSLVACYCSCFCLKLVLFVQKKCWNDVKLTDNFHTSFTLHRWKTWRFRWYFTAIHSARFKINAFQQNFDIVRCWQLNVSMPI